MIGRTIGHYEVVGKLGEGGMGAVFKAKDTHLDRFVALKVLPHDKMSDPERKRRFTQEAKAASALNHPNIITIYDINSSDGVDYIAMEFVEGRTLEALVTAGPLKVSDTVKYARQMADALTAAHAAGILHRDLKPANVMVRESGLVKVLDFGLAKLTDDSSDTLTDNTRTMSSTRAGQILGTVAYMSPEQAEGKKLDFRSDIFSFGVVMYEMSAGTRAFPGDSQASVLAAILRDDPRPVAESRSDMPWELDQLISRCLRKDPARRVQTMADLKAALDDLPDFLTRSVSSTTTSGRSFPVPPPMPAPAVTPPPVPPPPVPVYSTSSYSASTSSYSPPVFTPPPLYPPPYQPAPPPVAFGEPRKSKRGRARWWIALGLLFAIPALVRQIKSVFRSSPGISSALDVVILKGVPLTGNEGTERTPSFSPDGNQVVYSWNGPGADNFDIYKKAIGEPSQVRLTKDASEEFAPAWSPDGNIIAFLRSRAGSAEILLVPAGGGAERKLGEVAQNADHYGLAWTKDSQHLIVSDAPTPGAAPSLYKWSITTGEKKRLTKPGKNDEGDYFPAVSPDGDLVAFVRNPAGFRAALFTLDITDDDESPQEIASLKMETSHPAWKADGRELIFHSGSGNSPLMWRVRADGSGKPVPLIGITSGLDPAISPEGTRMVYLGKPRDKGSHPLMLVEKFR